MRYYKLPKRLFLQWIQYQVGFDELFIYFFCVELDSFVLFFVYFLFLWYFETKKGKRRKAIAETKGRIVGLRYCLEKCIESSSFCLALTVYIYYTSTWLLLVPFTASRKWEGKRENCEGKAEKLRRESMVIYACRLITTIDTYSLYIS